MARRKVSFKSGTVAAKARSKLAERIKRSGSAANPFAVASKVVKKMSSAKRAKVARSRKKT